MKDEWRSSSFQELVAKLLTLSKNRRESGDESFLLQQVNNINENAAVATTSVAMMRKQKFFALAKDLLDLLGGFVGSSNTCQSSKFVLAMTFAPMKPQSCVNSILLECIQPRSCFAMSTILRREKAERRF